MIYNVLSLFDGCSGAQVALNNAGIKYNTYYASEIDPYAVKITQKNYPDTIQLGDIKKIKGKNLPKIDLLIGGSPCQGFSFAGKQLNFKDVRSKLFFEFVRLLQECKPTYFLLENVKMKLAYQNVISKHLKVNPVEINSNLVSAQNRKRLYWTNIPGITQPEDKHIYLKDIILSGVVCRDKSYCIDANYYKGGSLKNYIEKCRRQIVLEKQEFNPACLTLARTEEGKRIRSLYRKKFGKDFSSYKARELVVRIDNKVNCLTTSLTKEHLILLYLSGEFKVRKLFVVECERLQNLPDNFTEGMSDTQRYKMIGNGFTVNVINHILNFIKK